MLSASAGEGDGMVLFVLATNFWRFSFQSQ
jgi:hypothetical protein